MTVSKDFFDLQVDGEMFQQKWSEMKQSFRWDDDPYKVQTFGDEMHSIKSTSREKPIDKEFALVEEMATTEEKATTKKKPQEAEEFQSGFDTVFESLATYTGPIVEPVPKPAKPEPQ